MLPDRYAEVRRIGHGGMGDIFRATDTALGRTVAVKVLAERYAADESVRARFTREAFAAARLSASPNTVTIFDVGEHEGHPYIVMEYLGGGTIAEKLVRQRDADAGQGARTGSSRRRARSTLRTRRASSTAMSSPRTSSSTTRAT